MQSLADIPSPSDGVWNLGPLPIRAYALMIIIGIVVAVWLGERRWIARGGTPNVVVDVAVWAVPFGLVGGRLYHVITDYQRYFVAGENPVDALKVWEGGLGIWGAIALGGVGAWIGCRRRGVSLPAFADAVAPGIALAQAIGRWGNWWNQELYGRPLDTWWAVRIDVNHRPADPRYADIATYHPTFLYESLWCLGVAVLVIWAGRRFTLTHGRTFALYVAAYTVGRFWIELLRIDDAHHILGLRLNDWTALVVFLGAVGYLWLARGRQGEERVTVTGRYAQAAAADGSADGEGTDQAEGAAASTTEATEQDEPAADDASGAGPSPDEPAADKEMPAKGKP
jgi:prolipoprotein diacylglyceryl transferase